MNGDIVDRRYEIGGCEGILEDFFGGLRCEFQVCEERRRMRQRGRSRGRCRISVKGGNYRIVIDYQVQFH
jgi:hypothetical protein